MLFIPSKENCKLWNQLEKEIYIICEFSNGDISFQIKKEYITLLQRDWFYLQVVQCCGITVLPCSLFSCKCLPQLRYNQIINKWFCCCPSSALSKNFETYLIKNTKINKQNGFADTAVQAVMLWNKMVAKDIIEQCDNKIKEC